MLDTGQADHIGHDNPPTAIPSSAIRRFGALRHRDFRRLWVGTFVSNLGSWAQKVAASWLIYRYTNSAAWLGIDAFTSGMSAVLVLPWGGVVADRFSRRSLLIWTNIASAVLAFALAALAFSDRLQVWHIIVASALSGIVQGLMSPASTSLLPTLVGDADTANAIALNSLQFNIARVVGPAIGGVALIRLGAPSSFVLNGISFVAMVIAVFLITDVPTVRSATESVWENIRGGLRFVGEARNIQTLLLLVMLAAFFGAPMISLLPALTESVLHREASTYAVLLSGFGLGAVIAAGLIATRVRQGPRPCRAVPYLMVYGASLVAVAFPLPSFFAFLLVALSGFAFINTMIRLGTALLQSSPEEYRGRVSSLQSLGFRLAQPLGSLAAGFVAHRFGVQIAFWLFGGFMIAAVLTARQLSTGLRTHQLISHRHSPAR